MEIATFCLAIQTLLQVMTYIRGIKKAPATGPELTESEDD